MEAVDPAAFEFAIAQIKDGFVFEGFAQDFLSSALGYAFVPVGGIKDRGIDGLEHTFTREGTSRTIYQVSIDQGPETKIKRTLETLVANDVSFDGLYYVTNQVVPKIDVLTDKLFETYGKRVVIYDLNWFSHRVNSEIGCIRAFNTFVTRNTHQFNQPGKHFVIADLVKDPRVFVFLRHQWDETQSRNDLRARLVDALILYALEGTDPDKGILKSVDGIRATIEGSVKFSAGLTVHVARCPGGSILATSY